jgi:hypothetical protein
MEFDSAEGDDRMIRSVEVSIPGKGTDSTAYLLKLSLLSVIIHPWVPACLAEQDRSRDSTPAEKAAHAAQELKIRKHVCRMGFNQAGRNRRLESFFFLTSGSYLPRGLRPHCGHGSVDQ